MHSKTDSRTRSNYTQKNKTEISKKWDKNESEKQPKRKKKTSDFSSGKYVCMYVNQIFVAVGREGEGRMMMMTPAKEWVVVIIDIPYECGMHGK